MQTRTEVKGMRDLVGRRRRLLGDFLVGEGLVSPAQLGEALRYQRTEAPHLRLGQILVLQEAISRDALETALVAALASSVPWQRLGDLLLEAGLISPVDLDAALRHQRRTGLRLGEVLFQLDLVPEARVREMLACQLGVTFVDPDRVAVDPASLELVGRRYARHHRVVPLSRAAGSLTLLVADPANTQVVREVAATVGCPVRVVTTTQVGFRRAFLQAYGEAV